MINFQISDRTGNTNDSFCLLCTAGKYCQDYGLALPNGDCFAGYYCPEGQDVPQPTNYACSPGHFCEIGSWNETGCPSGMYQPHWARSTCEICPAGSYCKAFGKVYCKLVILQSKDLVKGTYLNDIYHSSLLNDSFLMLEIHVCRISENSSSVHQLSTFVLPWSSYWSLSLYRWLWGIRRPQCDPIRELH